MRSTARRWLLLLPWTLLGAPATAGAATGAAGSKVAVLPLTVKGNLDGDSRDTLTANLRSGLERGSFTVIPQADVEARAESPCTRQTCYDKLRSTLGVDYIVRTTVEVKNRDYAISLDLIESESGKVIASTKDQCDICGLGEVGEQITAQGALLSSKLDAMGTGPAVLVLSTDPSGAIVTLDGEEIGTTPIEHRLVAGTHRVRVSKEGFVADEREITFVAGVTEKLSVDLRRAAASSKMRALGAGLVGGGVAALAGGVALLVLDDCYDADRCYQILPKSCESEDRTQCERVLNTSWGGGALVAGGAALVTAGVMLLVRHRKPKAQSNVSAGVAPTGFFISGRF